VLIHLMDGLCADSSDAWCMSLQVSLTLKQMKTLLANPIANRIGIRTWTSQGMAWMKRVCGHFRMATSFKLKPLPMVVRSHCSSRNIRNRKYCSFNSDDPSMAERHAKLKAKGYTDQDDFDFDEEEEEEVYYGIAAPTSNSVPDYKKEVIMNNKNVSELMKRSATAGGYGAVAMQATKRTKGALIKILEKKGADHATMMVVSSLLDTEGGTTLVHLMLGMCCIYAPIPGLKDNEHVQKLGEHFVTKGFETGMSSGMDLLAEVIGPAIAEAFGALQQQRVETPALDSAKQRVALVAPSVSDLTESEITAAYEQMQARKAASAGLDRKGE